MEETCVLGTSVVEVGAFSVLFVVFPLTLVGVAFGGVPAPEPLLVALLPLALKLLAVDPGEHSRPVSFALEVGSLVSANSGLFSPSDLQIFVENALKELVFVDGYAFAMSFAFF